MREPVIPRFDAQQYLDWESRQEDKFELVHGFLVAFAGGTFDHDQISFNIRSALHRVFPPPCRSIGSDVKIRVADRIFFYADAGVVCLETPGKALFTSVPLVVAEVLSPSTRAYDLVEKRERYQNVASLNYYLIAHTEYRRVELDVRDPSGIWRTSYYDEGEFPIGNGTITLDEVYAESSLART